MTNGPEQARRPLTADEISSIGLGRSGIGRRGYDESEVDRLLDRLAREVETRDWQLADMRTQIQKQNALLHGRSPQAAVTQDAVRVLEKAQETADRVVRDSRNQARLILDDAYAQADGIVHAAREAADAAAQRYRRDAGEDYTPDGEQAARTSAHLDAVLAALQGAAGHLNATIQLVRTEVAGGAPHGPVGADGVPLVTVSTLTALAGTTEMPILRTDGHPQDDDYQGVHWRA